MISASSSGETVIPRVYHAGGRVLDDLLPDIVPDALDVLQPKTGGRLALPLFDGLLNEGDVGAGLDRLAVDLPVTRLREQPRPSREPAWATRATE
jgi:hypothetical protein